MKINHNSNDQNVKNPEMLNLMAQNICKAYNVSFEDALSIVSKEWYGGNKR